MVRPNDLPKALESCHAVMQSTKFVLVVNLKTAKTLGLTMPESFLLHANEVIE
jgi:putative ABC transport system substrate-binding protein